ncbi:MAG: beta-N-acetylhexosaminidase [Kiritimatiellae bacterium]|nr:beta-N-acetylhexosaminidase [Kiritimatiellia bacterium]
MTNILGIAATALALVPAPKEQVWREGICAYVEADVRYVRDAALPPEGYRLDITTGGVTVASADDAGAFYARKTLGQLRAFSAAGGGTPALPGRVAVPSATVLPCCEIKDAPAFRWRGFMLDEGRHFFGKETVKALLDQMADHKLNVFHWHLTEDQGWRLDIPRFPELVKYGAVRPESPVHGCRGTKGDYRGNGQPYGPYFYTADDIREILAYAKDRFITVVPEIEVPGHVRALLAAHPEFACKEGLPRVPCMFNGVQDDVLCAGNDDAIRFMEQVYDEVCALFPGTYIHIGGDECPKKRWKECPKCQARIKTLGLKDEDELQAWVTRHFTDYLAQKGRRAIGWDEVFAGGPGKETIIQGWHIQHGNKFGLRAAEAGHPTIVSDLKSTYFSVPQGVADDPFTYLSPGMRCSLATAYAFSPLAGMTDAAKPHVLGAECCLWSECVWNEYDLAFKLWPRACAFAEAVWTGPVSDAQQRVPPAGRDFEDFKRRMAVHRRRLVAAGVNCAPLD